MDLNEKKDSKYLYALKIISYIFIYILLFLCVFFSIYNLKIPTEKIYNDNIEKVVEIKASDDKTNWSCATGCFIDKNGTILTNKHVVFNSLTNSNFRYIQVRIATNEEYFDAVIINVSDKYDLATIKTDFTNTKYFEFAKDCKNGETIYTIGNPNNFGLSFSSGVISASSRKILYNGNYIDTLQTSLVTNEGNSGGPVFNSKGELIGLISFRLKNEEDEIIQGISFAVPINNIKEFIS